MELLLYNIFHNKIKYHLCAHTRSTDEGVAWCVPCTFGYLSRSRDPLEVIAPGLVSNPQPAVAEEANWNVNK